MIKFLIKNYLKSRAGKQLVITTLKNYVALTDNGIDDAVVNLIAKLLDNNFNVDNEVKALLDELEKRRNGRNTLNRRWFPSKRFSIQDMAKLLAEFCNRCKIKNL